jgi:hypothetical protein
MIRLPHPLDPLFTPYPTYPPYALAILERPVRVTDQLVPYQTGHVELAYDTLDVFGHGLGRPDVCRWCV